MNPIALVGFGPSREYIYKLEDMPVWSLTDAYLYNLPRLDRVFEMHPLKDLVLEGERWKRLQTDLPYPVYMLDKYEEVPSSVKYPLDLVLEECFGNLFVGSDNARYLDSSFPYMIALAQIEGYNPIYIIGCELRSDTEYRYQRVGVSLLAGWAAGRGTTVIFPENNALLPPTLYGYEEFQHYHIDELYKMHSMYKEMRTEYLERINEDFGTFFKLVKQSEGALHILKALIEICEKKRAETGEKDQHISRQNLEQYLSNMYIQESEWLGKFNAAHARAVERGITEDKDREEAFKEMYMRSGAIQLLKFMIEKLDRGIVTFSGFEDYFTVYESKE